MRLYGKFINRSDSNFCGSLVFFIGLQTAISKVELLGRNQILREGSRAIEGAPARTVVQPRRPLKDFMWQSPMCSMRSGSTHPQFEAGLLLRLMAPPRIKVAAVLYQGSLNCGLFRSKIIKVLC